MPTPINLPYIRGDLLFKALSSWCLKVYRLILSPNSIDYDSLSSIPQPLRTCKCTIPKLLASVCIYR